MEIPTEEAYQVSDIAKEIDISICEVEPKNGNQKRISEESAVHCELCGMGINMESLCAGKLRKVAKSPIECWENFRMRSIS